MIDPYDAWDPWPVNIEPLSGPSRVYDSDVDDETPPPQIIGFRPRAFPDTDHPAELSLEPEPLLWEGDNA